MSAHRRILLALALLAPIGVAATTVAGDASAEKKPPAVDKLANALGGQILFFDSKPPDIVAGPGTLTAKKITKKEENSDKKWVIHMMIFLKKPLDVNKLDLLIYKHDKKGIMGEMVHKLEQFPSGDGRTFYFVVPLEKYKPIALEPNLKYTFKAVASTGPVAEGTIELDGKEEKVEGNSNLDFTNGVTDKPKEEKATAPFDAAVTKENLKKVIYEDCKTSASKGGASHVILTISKDGKVLRAEFEKEPPPPYSDGTQKCILGRFEKMKTKAFTGEQKTISYKISL